MPEMEVTEPKAPEASPWPFVAVEMEVPADSYGWVGDENHPAPSQVVVRGWLVREELDYVVLSRSVDAYGDLVLGATAIPRSAILSMRRVGEE